MTSAKNEKIEAQLEHDVRAIDIDNNAKICFIIMPIADHPEYEPGHFQRVYEYLIKPACIAAGLIPYRADDNKASDMIMLDILQKIVECDMAICDISSRNANVFFELGLRQAFNKKTILITDGLQNAPFDISGLRHVPYSPTLRVDTVAAEVPKITKMLTETQKLPDNKVNSVVQLLNIRPAKVDAKDLPPLDSVVYEMFSQLKEQISSISPNKVYSSSTSISSSKKLNRPYNNKVTLSVDPKVSFDKIYKYISTHNILAKWQIPVSPQQNDEFIFLGSFESVQDENLIFRNEINEVTAVKNTAANRSLIKSI